MISLKRELGASKSSLIFMSLEQADIIAETRMFFLMLLSVCSFHITFPCLCIFDLCTVNN